MLIEVWYKVQRDGNYQDIEERTTDFPEIGMIFRKKHPYPTEPHTKKTFEMEPIINRTVFFGTQAVSFRATDVDPVIANQLGEYGEYSTKFSCANGIGLPGRVFKSGQSSWERRLDLADPGIFERAGGASVYGIKTGIGIALSTSSGDRLLLCLYSLDDLDVDTTILAYLERDLAEFCPKPKWKIVVDIDSFDTMNMSSDCSLPEALPPKKPYSERNRSNSMNSNLSSHSHHQKPLPRELELVIAKLLTDFLTGANLPGAYPDSDDGLLPFYMSLRLSLLRNPDRRSSEENNKLDIIRSSYEVFARCKSHSPKRIVDMIVRDWRFLNMSMDSSESISVAHKSIVTQHPFIMGLQMEFFRPSATVTQAKL